MQTESSPIGSVRISACTFNDTGQPGVIIELAPASEGTGEVQRFHIEKDADAHAFLRLLASAVVHAWPQLSAQHPAEQAIGPALEALQLAEELLDLDRRELKLGGSDPDLALELAHRKAVESIAQLKAVVRP